MASGNESDRAALVSILKDAYSGELAAALAYGGHWKSVRDPAQREMIQRIEREEWDHRERVGKMLAELNEKPSRRKEVFRKTMGHIVAIGCRMVGWFIPMFFAGRLEGQNICAYDIAAPHAKALGLADFERELVDMANVERGHEDYFLGLIVNHRMFPLMRSIFGWGCKIETAAPAPVTSERTA
jgi:rubrerythrin